MVAKSETVDVYTILRGRAEFFRGTWVVAYRELLRFATDRMRWAMALSMPLMTFVIFGAGFNRLVPSSSLGSGINFMQYVFPGVVAMSVLMSSLNAGLSVVSDREFGFLKEVLVAPLSRHGVVLGKAAGGMAVALLQALLLLILAPFVGVPVTLLSALGMLGALAVVSLALAGLGILIASRMRSQQGFHLLLNLIVFPMMFLSGMYYPVSAVPSWLAVAAMLNPVTYGVDAVRQVMLGTVSGVSLFGQRLSVLTDLLILGAVGFSLMSLAVWSFGRKS